MNLGAFLKGMLVGGVILSGVIWSQESLVSAQECDGPCPSPSPSPVRTLDLGKDGPNCGQNHFYVNAVARINGVEQAGVEVTFKYKAETVKKKTNLQGRAEADIPFKGDDQVSAEAGGYPSQSVGVDSKAMDNCEPVKTIAVTKMADTGGFLEEYLQLVVLAGVGLFSLGALVYAKTG